MASEIPKERAFGKYLIQEEIGRGGFGTVFRALDTTLDRPVALKILDPLLMRDRNWAGRFRREARVMGRLDHPYIVPIFEIGTLEGRLFLAMKLIDGPNLADRIGRQGTFSWEETPALAGQLAAALDYAHDEGLVHRDLKPGNVLLANGSAMLTDFGLSRLASDNSMSVSMTGGVIGTPSYIAPESWEGGEVSGRADQYALACLVSEMLTGEMVFTGKTPPEIMMAHFKPPQFPETWPEGVPPEIEKVLQTALARDPADRFESCRAFVEALQGLEQDVLAPPYADLEKAISEQRWENALDLADGIRAKDDNYRDIRALEQRALDGLAAEQNTAAIAQWRDQAEAFKVAGNIEMARMAARKWQELSGDEAAGAFLSSLEAAESPAVDLQNQDTVQDKRGELKGEPINETVPDDTLTKDQKATTKPAQNQPPVPAGQPKRQPVSPSSKPSPSSKEQVAPPAKSFFSNMWLWGGLAAVVVIGVIYWATMLEPETIVVEVTREVERVAEDEMVEEVIGGDAILEAARSGAYDGTTVSMFGAFVDEDARRFESSVAAFEKETGIDIQYEGSGDFETLIQVRVDGGDPPDIGGHPQPGLVAGLVRQGAVVDPSDFLGMDFLERQYSQGWIDDSTLADQIAGVWYRGNVKSLVWYPKDDFEAAGYEIPTSWDELIALSDQMVADGGVPWCIGIESSGATGWVATDWVEDIMLRTQPPEKYDEWTAGELPFDSPEIRNALDTLATIWKNPDYVLGGDVGIVTTPFGDSPTGLFDDPPSCWMHRQASFIPAFFPDTAEIGTNVDFFYFPGIDPAYGEPMLTAGDIAVMYNDRPEVRAVMAYLATGESMKGWVEAGGFISPHQDSSLDWYTTDVDRRFAELLLASEVTRFDGSDLMPAAVGAGAFWTEMTDWVTGASEDEILPAIDAAWPR